MLKKKLKNNLKYLIKDFDFYIEVFNLYLDCPFFTKERKEIFQKMKRKIIIKKRYYF